MRVYRTRTGLLSHSPEGFLLNYYRFDVLSARAALACLPGLSQSPVNDTASVPFSTHYASTWVRFLLPNTHTSNSPSCRPETFDVNQSSPMPNPLCREEPRRSLTNMSKIIIPTSVLIVVLPLLNTFIPTSIQNVFSYHPAEKRFYYCANLELNLSGFISICYIANHS